jgi:hypothetical protein
VLDKQHYLIVIILLLLLLLILTANGCEPGRSGTTTISLGGI